MTLEIGEPSYSWREIVAAADRARGRELPVHFVPPGGELPLLDPAVCGWLSSFETYEDFIDMDDLPTRFGLEITPLPTVMKQMFGPRKSLYLVNGLPTNPGHYPFQMKPFGSVNLCYTVNCVPTTTQKGEREMADDSVVKKAKSGEKNLSGADLSGADLRWLDFSGADLEKANLRGADLSGVNLKKVNLSGADLRGADLSGQFLSEGKLSGAIYDETTKWPKHFNPKGTGAVLT